MRKSLCRRHADSYAGKTAGARDRRDCVKILQLRSCRGQRLFNHGHEAGGMGIFVLRRVLAVDLFLIHNRRAADRTGSIDHQYFHTFASFQSDGSERAQGFPADSPGVFPLGFYPDPQAVFRYCVRAAPRPFHDGNAVPAQVFVHAQFV